MDEAPRTFRRVVTIADLHCGHEFGLTPPAWHYIEDGHPRIAKVAKFQRALWGFYTEAIDSLKPIDVLIVNGDAIDGKGDKSGGVEQCTTDRLEQCEMAAEAINRAEAPLVRLLFGTRYHVGSDEDFEQTLCDKVYGRVSIQGHGFFDIGGVMFDIKHKVGGSSIPHSRMTALARARLWNQIWSAEHERQPQANIIQRAHVHYFTYCGGRDWVAMASPALSYGTSYGIRECEGIVDVGMLVVDISDQGGWTWRPILAQFKEMKAPVEYL